MFCSCLYSSTRPSGVGVALVECDDYAVKPLIALWPLAPLAADEALDTGPLPMSELFEFILSATPARLSCCYFLVRYYFSLL